MNENLIRRKLATNPIYFIPLNTFKLRIRHKNLITCIPSFLHTIISLHSLILLFKASFHICYKLLHLAQTINGKKSIFMIQSIFIQTVNTPSVSNSSNVSNMKASVLSTNFAFYEISQISTGKNVKL